jgi:hypothetical protein
MLEFTRRIKRIHVHDHAARAQDGRHRHRILQHVRHHHRDARPTRRALLLQPGGEMARLHVEFRVRQRAAMQTNARFVACVAKLS